jgi:hypothetical protein
MSKEFHCVDMQSFIVHLVCIKLYVHDGHVLGHPDIVL